MSGIMDIHLLDDRTAPYREPENPMECVAMLDRTDPSYRELPCSM